MEEEARTNNRRINTRLIGRNRPRTYETDEENGDEIQINFPVKRRSSLVQDAPATAENSNNKTNDDISMKDDGERVMSKKGHFIIQPSPMQNSGNETAKRKCEDDNPLMAADVSSSISSLFGTEDFSTAREPVNKTDADVTKERIIEILKSVPKQVVSSLHDPSERRPYRPRLGTYANHQLVDKTKSTCTIQKYSPSSMPPNQSTERECSLSSDIFQKGATWMTTTTLGGQQSESSYKQIEEHGSTRESWPKPATSPDHACPMIELMREGIVPSRQQPRHGWEAVKDSFQKIKELEQQIKQLQLQLQSWKAAEVMNESVIECLRESRSMASYATTNSIVRQKARSVFCDLLQHAFPLFGHQDLRMLFEDIASDPNQSFLAGSVVQTGISKEIDRLEEPLSGVKAGGEGPNTPSTKHSSINPSRLPVQPQSPTPLTVVTTSLEAQPVLQIASETKALAASLHQPSPKTPKTLLTPSQFRERQILKLCLPHSQSTSLLNKNASNAPSNKLEFKIVPDVVKRTVTGTPLIKPNVPTLIRRLPSATNQKIQVSSATIVKMTPRQSALRFAIQQRMNPKRSIPLRRPRQETQTSNSSDTAPQKSSVISHPIYLTKSSQPNRLNSGEIITKMARSVMEAAQEENKRRLEALFPIKTESADQS